MFCNHNSYALHGAHGMAPTNGDDVKTPQEIAAMQRYSDATRGVAGKPISPLQYWIRRATLAEKKLQERRTSVFAASMFLAAGYITGVVSVIVAYFA